MEIWLCREKGSRLMEKGKVQEAVACDLLLQVSYSMGAEIPLPSVERGDKRDAGARYKGDERVDGM